MNSKIGALAALAIGLVFACPMCFVSADVSAEDDATEFVLGAVGDIATTQLPHSNLNRNQYDDVARLATDMGLDGLLTVGDAQHNDGTYEDYMAYFDLYFSTLHDTIYPTIGNHDYSMSDSAEGYFTYFADRVNALVGDDDERLRWGYYSFDMGSWHIVCLNSILGHPWWYWGWNDTSPGPAEAQLAWLDEDLAAHDGDSTGTIVFFHHPRYDWESYYTSQSWGLDEMLYLTPYWEVMYEHGVDLVLGGHNHNYMRWAPQDAYGNYDPAGPRQLIVGTGGSYFWGFKHNPWPANLEFGVDDSFGILKLKLRDGSYDFEFVSTEGKVLDGMYDQVCH